MKLYLLILLLFFACGVHAQVKVGNKTRQIEQLQQLKQTLSRKIDTLHLQLMAQADSIEDVRKKLDQIKKDGAVADKPDPAAKDQSSKVSHELFTATALENNLQRKFDQRMQALDKAINLQKDLEEKINTLLRESNR